MRPGALPISDQILLDIIIPPAGAVAWWIAARGWAMCVQENGIPQETRTRQKWGFWALLGIVYLLSFGITIYGWLT